MRIPTPFALVLFLAACSSSSSDSVADAGDTSSTDGGSDAGALVDSGSTDAGAPGADGGAAGSCTAAIAGLATTADPSAPVLGAATSMLQRVSSNDASCTTQQASHPGFGPFGYLLNIAYTDPDGDGPTLDELSAPPGPARFGSSPDASIGTRFDPMHGWTTQGSGASGTLILQLCLDKVYPAGTLAIGVDLADKATHRSAAICISEPTGG